MSSEQAAPVGVALGHEEWTVFQPPRLLRNAHVQTMLNNMPWVRAAVLRRAQPLLEHAKPHVVDCGEGVRLLGFHSAQTPLGRTASRGLALLLHGWEGSSESTYVLSLGARLYAQGFDVFRLNLRDHGPTHHLNLELFHSCRIVEVVGAVRRVQELFAPARMSLVGFSLGGNFALRVAVRAPQAGIELQQVVAISPALNPHATMHVLESGPAIYSRYFINKWKRSLRIKQRHFPEHYDLRDILACNSITTMTDCLVRRYTNMAGLDEYLSGYSIIGDKLARLQIPSTVIASHDDPIIPARDLQQLARSPQLRVLRSQFGGHCGFADRWNGERWLDAQVLRLLL